MKKKAVRQPNATYYFFSECPFCQELLWEFPVSILKEERVRNYILKETKCNKCGSIWTDVYQMGMNEDVRKAALIAFIYDGEVYTFRTKKLRPHGTKFVILALTGSFLYILFKWPGLMLKTYNTYDMIQVQVKDDLWNRIKESKL